MADTILPFCWNATKDENHEQNQFNHHFPYCHCNCIAIQLAQNGFHVVINYRNEAKKDLAEEAAAACRSYGVQAACFRADVSQEADCEALVAFTKETFGSIDVLVNNAGITAYTLLTRLKEAQYRELVSCNQDSVFFMTKHTAKVMKKQSYGRIINIASMAGVKGFAGGFAYSATKGAVLAMTKAAAKELACHNITVNAIAPGMIATEMTNIVDASQNERVAKNIGMKRYGKPEEIAGAVVYLASPNASYTTGTVIEIHGSMES